MAQTHGRHTPAFLLLLLRDGPSYGALLLSRLQSELPFCLSDSAIVYRSLKKMEDDGLVETEWIPQETGQPRKWYTLNETGRAALADCADDIRRRLRNLQFFMDQYETGRTNR